MIKIKFSSGWRKSKSPKKQRKYRYNAPLHIKQKLVRIHLSKELRKKHSKRSLAIKKGDKVKVVAGQFKGKTGKVERVDLKRTQVYLEGVDMAKKDGSRIKYPIHPSNLMLTEINLDDKMRNKILERK
jgi:large subunit ribosomal protein L24